MFRRLHFDFHLSASASYGIRNFTMLFKFWREDSSKEYSWLFEYDRRCPGSGIRSTTRYSRYLESPVTKRSLVNQHFISSGRALQSTFCALLRLHPLRLLPASKTLFLSHYFTFDPRHPLLITSAVNHHASTLFPSTTTTIRHSRQLANSISTSR